MDKFDIGERNTHWQFYLDKLREVASKYTNPEILKLDGYNELLDVPVDGGIANNIPGARCTILEYEVLFARKVSRLYPNLKVVQGDIRDLPFTKNDRFDIIADLSTIDHVSFKSLDLVFGGYKKVLNDDGTILMFAWVTTNPMVSDETEKRHEVWQSISQYFFPYHDFCLKLDKYFVIREQIATPNTGTEGDTWLNCFVLEKRV